MGGQVARDEGPQPERQDGRCPRAIGMESHAGQTPHALPVAVHETLADAVEALLSRSVA